MKDFDRDRPDPKPEQDRRFKLRGLEFTVRPFVRPEALGTIEDTPLMTSSLEILQAIDTAIMMYLEPEDHDAWRRLRENEDDAITLDELQAIAEWLAENEARRPTPASSASTGGRASTMDSSEALSGSREAIPTA